MKSTIESVFCVRPEVFWDALFFDPEYNEGLYRELGFVSYEVLSVERGEDGSVRRRLRAEPPFSGPDVLKRTLRGRLTYVEQGSYDPARERWDFESTAHVAGFGSKVRGSIRVAPHPAGLLHVVELDVRVSAPLFATLAERAIEKSTRESYGASIAYTNAFAARRGLAPRD